MNSMDTHESISALADGQLRGEAFAQAVHRATVDSSAREAWATYHLIGDVLRSPDLAAGGASSAFVSRFQARLQSELATMPVSDASAAPRTLPAIDVQRPAANEANWRWKLVAGFASVTAVAALGWNLVGVGAPAPQPQIANTAPAPSTQVLAGTGRGTMIRDARLDQLLTAHRQFGSATALQTSGGFLRNATYEGQAR